MYEAPKRNTILVVGFVTVIADLVFCLLVGSASLGDGIEFLAAVFMGSVAGQIVFALITSGLLGKSWVRSWFVGVGLSMVLCFLMVLSLGIGSGLISNRRSEFWEPVAMLLSLPSFAIAGTFPMWFLRFFLGWSIARSDEESTTRSSIGVEDILLLTATIAAVLMLSRASLLVFSRMGVFTDSEAPLLVDSFWYGQLFGALVFGLVSMPFTWISTAIIFRSSTGQGRVAGMFVFAFCTVLVLLVIVTALSMGSIPSEVLMFMTLFLCGGFATATGGLCCLVTDGFELRKYGRPFRKKNDSQSSSPTSNIESPTSVPANSDREAELQDPFGINAHSINAASEVVSSNPSAGDGSPVEPAIFSFGNEAAKVQSNTLSDNLGIQSYSATSTIANESNPDPFSDDEIQVVRKSSSSRFLDRALVGSLLVLAVFFTFVRYSVEGARNGSRALKNQAKQTIIEASRSILMDESGDITVFAGQFDANDSISEMLLDIPSLEVIDLSNSEVTNEAANQIIEMTNLEKLNLSGTKVTDELFSAIPPGKFRLTELDISDTRITIEGIAQIARRVQCDRICLRGMKLTDADIKILDSLKVTSWDLRDNPIGIVPVNSISLTIGKNSIDPASLPDLVGPFLKRFEIDGMKISDTQFESLTHALPNLRALSISNTDLTDAVFEKISRLPQLTELSIGVGNFTDNGLADSPPNVERLRIHNSQVTGSFLSNLDPSIQFLDLSRSGVTDANLRNMSKNVRLSSIDLSHTAVSARILPHLRNARIYEVDIQGTSITAKSLLNLPPGNYLRLIIDRNQLSIDEKALIESRQSLKFTDRFSMVPYQGY